MGPAVGVDQDVAVRRFLGWSAAALVLIGLGALAGGGWYYSEQLLEVPTPADAELSVAILAADEAAGTVTLPEDADPDLSNLENVGLVTSDGVLLLDGLVARRDGEVVRNAELVAGDWPAPGAHAAASLDGFAGDPAEALGLPFDDVDVAGELGPLPAWRVVPRGADRAGPWVVIVHGRGAPRSEGNRTLAVAAEAGLPSLVISLRNDPEAPAAPDGFGRFGDTEWQDLQAAVDHLREVEGARSFVLVGYSQGASIALTFLRRSPDARAIDGAVLISPLVSLDATLTLQAAERGIPSLLTGPLLRSTDWITTWRSGLELERLEHIDAVDELPPRLPLLITHGDADRTVPVEPTRRFAAELGERATYLEFEGADHVREWNVDRERFEEHLRAFLEEVR